MYVYMLFVKEVMLEYSYVRTLVNIDKDNITSANIHR